MKQHPNKEIRAAIDAAVEAGWKVVESGKSSHAFCRLKCGEGHREHQMSIWSTPRNATAHARQIRRKIEECQP